MFRPCLILALSLLAAGPAGASEAAKVPDATFELSNGMKFLRGSAGARNRLSEARAIVLLVVGKWEEIAPGDAGGRARMKELFGGEVTHLPLRDPKILMVIP